jgi:hypothetical protein
LIAAVEFLSVHFLWLQQTNKLQHGTMVMSQVAAFAYPNASSWPFVWIDGYWKIVENVVPTSCYTGIHLAPLVQPEQAEAFEEWAYTKFEETYPEHPDMGNRSHFGQGIWGKSWHCMRSIVRNVRNRV